MVLRRPRSGECPFCQALDPGVLVYQDDATFALIDPFPINPYHTLVVPRAHYTAFADLPTTLVSRVFLVAQRVSRALRVVCRPDAITHLTDDDVEGRGFNLVPHFKVHLIPRHANDRVRIDWKRPPPPGPARRAQHAQELRAALRSRSRRPARRDGRP